MKRHVDALVRAALNDAIQGGHLRTRTVPPFTVDVPRHPAFGDLACDVALVLGRQLGKSPHAIGAAIAGRVRDPGGWLAEVGIGGPGFVNFRFAPPFWGAILTEALAAGSGYGRSDVAAGRRVRLELGRVRENDAAGARAGVVADAVAAILRAAGADVEGAGGGPSVGSSPPDELIRIVSGHSASTLPPAGDREPAASSVRLLPVGPVRVTRDGSPAGDGLAAAALRDERGADALRFLLLLERTERPIDLDLELAKREGTDNPLFLVQCAYARLVRRVADRERPLSFDPSHLGPADVEGLRALARWPDVLEIASRALEPDRIARFAVDLGGAAHRWLNRNRPGAGGEAVERTQSALAGCLAGVFREALARCNIVAAERM